jgi:hypothetical protein
MHTHFWLVEQSVTQTDANLGSILSKNHFPFSTEEVKFWKAAGQITTATGTEGYCANYFKCFISFNHP